MTIKDRLDKMKDEERRQLMYAFDHEFSQMVKNPDGTFVGVNIRPSDKIEIITEVGVWSYGRIKDA